MSIVQYSESTVEFDTQLRALAERAHSRYAGEGARIDRGLVLALNGHVTLCPDGTALVRSEKHYEVQYQVANGICDCPDAPRAPEQRCKHRYAVCLVRKAQRPAPPVRWYARYRSAEREQLVGIAAYTAQGWTFTPEGGDTLSNVILHDLDLLGHVETADAQAAEDRARLAQAWEQGMLRAGCQIAA